MFVNDVPISFRSVTQKFVTLSVTEAEIAAGVMVAQDMLYIYRLMESLELEVDLPFAHGIGDGQLWCSRHCK